MSKEELFYGGFWWRGEWHAVRDNGWGKAGKPAKLKPRPPMPPEQSIYLEDE